MSVSTRRDRIARMPAAGAATTRNETRGQDSAAVVARDATQAQPRCEGYAPRVNCGERAPGLPRLGAEREGDVPPRIEEGHRRWQMENDATYRDDDVDAQFEQPLPQPGHLGARTGGAPGPQAEFLHEDVRRRREEHAQLIRPEATATRASDLESIVEFLDPILDVSTSAVDVLIDPARRLPQIRDHEAGVVARLPARQAHHFGFDDHAALVRPGSGGVVRLGVDMFGLSTRLAQGASLDHRRVGDPRQYHVFRHGDDVVQAGLGIEEVKDLGCRKAAIEADQESRLRKGVTQQGEQSAQDAARATRRSRIPWTEQRRTEILLALVIKGDERQQGQIAPRVIVPVEERELLRAVGRVVGRIEVDRDVAGAAMDRERVAGKSAGAAATAPAGERAR